MQQEVMPGSRSRRRVERVTNLLASTEFRPPHTALVLTTPDHTLHVALTLPDVVRLQDLLATILQRDRRVLPQRTRSAVYEPGGVLSESHGDVVVDVGDLPLSFVRSDAVALLTDLASELGYVVQRRRVPTARAKADNGERHAR